MDGKLESGNAVLQTILASDNGRALKLLQQRQKRTQEMEQAKSQMEGETKRKRILGIDAKYAGSSIENLEEEFKKETIGLVSAAEYKQKRQRLAELASVKEKASADTKAARRTASVVKSKLSFDDDGEEDEDPESEEAEADAEGVLAREGAEGGTGSPADGGHHMRHFGKDPSAATSFLADPERDRKLEGTKALLIKEYEEEQERIRDELLEVTFSYWDGSGHRRAIEIRKGATIGEFINKCRRSLEKEFPELRHASSDTLLYVKEDLILPNHVTFYELIKNRARGKSGPLFEFDVFDDVRFYQDVRKEKNESHSGKIVERKWYERNRHIFPASRWEPFDSTKTYEKYTIHGDHDYSKPKA
eukprot:Polyplicarium_translucidae@DN1278_c0_g1_i1.p1